MPKAFVQINIDKGKWLNTEFYFLNMNANNISLIIHLTFLHDIRWLIGEMEFAKTIHCLTNLTIHLISLYKLKIRSVNSFRLSKEMRLKKCCVWECEWYIVHWCCNHCSIRFLRSLVLLTRIIRNVFHNSFFFLFSGNIL